MLVFRDNTGKHIAQSAQQSAWATSMLIWAPDQHVKQSVMLSEIYLERGNHLSNQGYKYSRVQTNYGFVFISNWCSSNFYLYSISNSHHNTSSTVMTWSVAEVRTQVQRSRVQEWKTSCLFKAVTKSLRWRFNRKIKKVHNFTKAQNSER